MFLTSFTDDETILSAIRGGAHGYLLKESLELQKKFELIGGIVKSERMLESFFAKDNESATKINTALREGVFSLLSEKESKY